MRPVDRTRPLSDSVAAHHTVGCERAADAADAAATFAGVAHAWSDASRSAPEQIEGSDRRVRTLHTSGLCLSLPLTGRRVWTYRPAPVEVTFPSGGRPELRPVPPHAVGLALVGCPASLRGSGRARSPGRASLVNRPHHPPQARIGGAKDIAHSHEIKRLSETAARERREAHMRGLGRALFVAILLLIAGTLNIIYGIAAVGNAHFFNNTQYVFSSLHTWGWITIIVGVIQLTAGFSLMGGRGYGRIIGIIAATIGALESLLSIGGAHPWWSIGIFVLCIYVLHGLIVFGEEEPTPRAAPPATPRV